MDRCACAEASISFGDGAFLMLLLVRRDARFLHGLPIEAGAIGGNQGIAACRDPHSVCARPAA